MKLYIAAVSGNSYKPRILLALLNVPYETVMIDLGRQQQKEGWYRKVNPRGEVPALEDDEVILWDSGACLVYIARKYGGDAWLPAMAGPMAEVMQWMALAASEIQFGLQYARRGVLQGRWTAGTLEQGQAIGRIALGVMEDRLRDHEWLALDRPTVADIACFPYTETAPEAKVSLEPYPAIAAWHARCRALPGWPVR